MSYPKQYNIPDFKAKVTYHSSSQNKLVELNTVILYVSYSPNTKKHLITHTDGKKTKSLGFSKIVELINLETGEVYNNKTLIEWFNTIEKTVPFVYMLPNGKKTTELRQITVPNLNENWIKDRKICVTGIFYDKNNKPYINIERKWFLKPYIEKMGGQFKSSLTGETDILLIADEPSEFKITEAKRRGMHLVQIKEFFNLVKRELNIDA